jgi:hypothetical protein
MMWALPLAAPGTSITMHVYVPSNSRAGAVELAWTFEVTSQEQAKSEAARQGFAVDTTGDADTSLRYCITLSAPRPRLVCAPSRATAAAAASDVGSIPPLTSALQLEIAPQVLASSVGSDLRSRLAPLVAQLVGIESRNQLFDSARSELLDALSGEAAALAQDVQSLHVDVHELDGGGARAEATVRFASRTSALARLLNTAHSGPAPELLWSLPGSTEHAVFNRRGDEQAATKLRGIAANLLDGLLQYQGTPDRLRERAKSVVARTPLPLDAVLYARGTIASTARSGELRAFEQDVGWQLLALDGSAERWSIFLDDLVSAYRDDVLGSQLRRVLRTAGESYVPLTITRRAPRVAALPKGSVTWDVTLPGRSIDPRRGAYVVDRAQPMPTVLALVPNEERTLLVWAPNVTVLGSVVQETLGKAGAFAGLVPEQLRAQGLLAGGVARAAASGSGALLSWFQVAASTEEQATFTAQIAGTGSSPEPAPAAPR